MRRILLYKRNYIITDSISKHAQGSSVFCAVGAGHLHGYKGILRLLKHKGFKVKPVKKDSLVGQMSRPGKQIGVEDPSVNVIRHILKLVPTLHRFVNFIENI